ncbi:hypothetical protein [Henriciella aquimarina]|uniref:hypothetical protein n=1 Tax=Henriciella aquimarina TaxID=545261 RepID=UPI0009FE85AA|nr:hypothetical protein [Henriciella aquimarina]
MSTRGHRKFLEGAVSWVFGAPVFRHRWIRWPLAAMLAGLAVHWMVSGAAVEAQDKSAAIPALLFLFAVFLVVLPLLPLADLWEERDGQD